MPEYQPTQSQGATLPPGYRVVALLGEGSFGKVYKAQGQGGLECAFKVIELNRDNVQEFNQGLKEFRAIGTVRHIKPHRHLLEYLGVWLLTSAGEFLNNAEELHDSDLADLDVTDLFIQMPLAVKSLESRLKECQRENRKSGVIKMPGTLPGIPLAELLPYMRGVAEALDHLHSRIHPVSENELNWVLHRDIKPANLLIDRKGEVLVADYGVARVVGANIRGTQTGAGSIAYMSPEQITSKVEVTDPASDQYSLAISYYEMRTGSYPFRDNVNLDQKSIELAHTMGWLDFARLPAAEQEILKRATQRTVSRRYSSCVAFVDELWKVHGRAPQPVWTPPATATEPLETSFYPSSTPATEPSDRGLPPEPLPGRAKRTSVEQGTVPENKPKPAEKQKPVPAKPSGTLGYGDTTRPAFLEPNFADEPLPAADGPLPLAEPEDEEVPAKSPWLKPSQSKRSKQTVWLSVAGVVLASGVGVAVAILANGGSPPLPLQPPAATPPPTEPPKMDDPKKDPPVPAYDKELEQARLCFASVNGKNEIDKVDEGLRIAALIPPTDVLVGPIAVSLMEVWKTARRDLANPVPTLSDSKRFAEWTLPKRLEKADEAPLRGVYERLAAQHPTAAIRLSRAREKFRKGTLSAGLIELSELLQRAPENSIAALANELQEVWSGAEVFDRKLIDRSPVTALDHSSKALQRITEYRALEIDDRKDIITFYSVRISKLAERLRTSTELSTDPLAWTQLKGKLPSKDEIDSPWLELLRVESAFMANYLTPTPKQDALPPLPKPGDDSDDLIAYRKLVATEWAWHDANSDRSKSAARRDAADKLVIVVGELGKSDLLTPARKRAFGLVLWRASLEMQKPSKAMDDPYAAEESIESARRCLQTAMALLDDETKAQRNEVRARLLLVLAFPKPDRAAAKAIDAANAVELAKALKTTSEQDAFWLAFARTRDLKTEADAALAGYEKTVTRIVAELDGKNDAAALAFAQRLAGYLRENKDDEFSVEQKKFAGEKLYLPLARQFFLHRNDKEPPPKSLAVDLAVKAAELTGNADHETLAGIFAIDAGLDRFDEPSVKKLADKAKQSSISRAYLGLVQFHNFESEKNETEKLRLLTDAAANLFEAVNAAKQADPEKILSLLLQKGVAANLQLGEKLEKGNKCNKAVDAFSKVLELSPTSSRALLARGRCNWNLAEGAEAADRLKNSRADLGLVKSTEAEYPEARLYLAYIKLFEQGMLAGGAPANYDYGKVRLVGIEGHTFTKEKLEAAESALTDLPPVGNSGRALELLEWAACVACARANAENGLNDAARETRLAAALDALAKLAAADPLAGALRRTQFLSYRLQTASGRQNDPELKSPRFQELWTSGEKRIKELQQLKASPDRLPGSPSPNRALFELFVLHAYAQAMWIPDLKRVPSPGDAQAYFDAMLKLLESGQVEKTEILTVLEAIGTQSTGAALIFRSEKKSEAESTAARFAALAFAQSGRIDPKLDRLAAYHQDDALAAARFRNYVAGQIVFEFSDAQLKNRPESVGEVVLADAILVQAQAILGGKKSPTETERTELAGLKTARQTLMAKKFMLDVEFALDALDKAEHPKAADWRKWKDERLKIKP